MIIKLQENIIKCQSILDNFEQDQTYRILKFFGIKGDFENSIRNLSNQTIGLRNIIINEIQTAIIFSENKELLKVIEGNYFTQIIEAASKESLIRIVNLNNISIPPTAFSLINQNDKVIEVIKSITYRIQDYNNTISTFRQTWNKFKINLSYFPNVNEFPDIIDGQINLLSLINSNRNNGVISNNNIINNNSQIGINSNNKTTNITNKF